MPASKLNELATRILRSNPVDDGEQKRILRLLNEVRTTVRGSSEQQPVVEYLDAATLLISYLANMGKIGGSEIRSVVARLIETAANVVTDGPEVAASPAAPALETKPALPRTSTPLSTQADQTPSTNVRVISDMMLGEIMVRMGSLQSEHIEKALEVQRQSGLKFGEALIKMGLATFDQVQGPRIVSWRYSEHSTPHRSPI